MGRKILFITTDQQRYDALGCNGGTIARTPVIDALSRIDSTVYANVHRGAHWLSDESTALYEEARDCVTTFIGAQNSKEIVFTQGTTAGINLVSCS